nr:MAG TPA: tail tube protein [Bacteriophage sp.]
MPRFDTSIIPQVLNDFGVYDGDGNKVIGVTNDMTLAEVAAKTVQMEGAGMSPMEVVVLGLYDVITQEIPVDTPYTQLINYLDTTKNAVLNVRGAIQTENRGTGETDAIQFRYMVSGKVKNLSPGNVKRGETFGSKITMTVNRLLIELNGESVLEIDKISNKVVVNGKDITAKIRKMC